MRSRQKGFTLVELAIVMVIIGLLIGGILRGQKMLEQAKVSSTITQVGSIDAATKTFYDTYTALPGDMLDAPTRLPNCANCGVAADTTPPNTAITSGTDGAGNLVIGKFNWNMIDFQSESYTGTPTGLSGDVEHETVLYWLELNRAGLISGITAGGINNFTADFGVSLPEAKIGGGFVVGWAGPGAAAPAQVVENSWPSGFSLVTPAYAVSLPSAVANFTDPGVALMLVPRVSGLTNGSAVGTANPGLQVLTPALAAQIDRKMDDQLPTSGHVQAYGDATSCFGSSPPWLYSEAVESKDCGLYFRIMKQ